MKTSTSCSCHSAPELCATGVIERPCYYPGQLLTPAELTLEQQYFRDKQRRHNRLLHGWGVVCGAAVCLVPEEQAAADPRHANRDAADRRLPTSLHATAKPKRWKVRVTPGYVLGPYGDEILIDREQVVDLRTCGHSGEHGDHGEPADPWCVDVYVQRDAGPLFVAVRYQETKSRPVRVQPAGCGCDETQCEYSRCRDGYEICVLTECPASHDEPPSLDDLFKGSLPDCPACPPEPWVVLAEVEVDADGAITALDNCSCRRMVASFASSWWRCAGDACAIASVEVTEDPVPGRDFGVNVGAYGLPERVEVTLGEGVRVKEATVSDEGRRLTVKATAGPSARPGPRTLEIKDADTHRIIAARREAVVIRAGGTAAPPPVVEPKPPVKPTPSPSPATPPKPSPGEPHRPEPAEPSAPARTPRGKGKLGKRAGEGGDR